MANGSLDGFRSIFTGGKGSEKVIKAGTLFITRGAGAIAVGLVGLFYGLDQWAGKGPWVNLSGSEKLRFVVAVGFIWAIVAAADAIARGISTGLIRSREPLVVLDPPLDGSFRQQDGHQDKVLVRALRLTPGDTAKISAYLISYPKDGITGWKTEGVTFGPP